MAEPVRATEEQMTALIAAAIKARSSAYAPYSDHPVGAAVLDENGVISAGANIENAAYPLSNCAEPTALGNMVLAGGSRVIHIVIAGPSDALCTPCGGCRQRIREFAAHGEARVTVVDRDGTILKTYDFFEELLPDSFGPDNVESVRS